MLEVNKLQVIYPNGNEALKSISLRAEPGEIIAVIGRSGAGKSTLLRCINGLQPVTSGEVILDNKCITRMGQKQLRLARREIAPKSLERVNMVHRANFRADRLSGGEKQCVSIARAIAQNPKILLTDEPVASLDPELSVQVMADLARALSSVLGLL